MSKNTSSSQFRKIDVDQFNDDVFRDEENAEMTSPTVGPDEREVNAFMAQGKHAEALKHILSSSPFASKNQLAKDNAYNMVMNVLLNVKASEIEKVVNQLNNDEIDLLMKYIYRGFETPNDGSSAHLLVWHEKTYAKGGVGSIVRVLTDKKRV